MAFVHGKNTRVLINGTDFSYWLKQAQTQSSAETAETSAFGTTSKTYVVGMTNSTMSLTGMFESTLTTGWDAVVTPLLGSETLPNVAVAPEGFAIGKRVTACSGIVTAYDVQGSVGDVVTAGLSVQGSDRASRGISLRDYVSTAIPATAGTTVEAVVDGGASSSTGWAAYLFVTGVPSVLGTTSLTVQLTDSATSGSGYTSVTGGAFTAVGGSITSEKKVSATNTSTLQRYVKLSSTVTGTGGTGGWNVAAVLVRYPY